MTHTSELQWKDQLHFESNQPGGSVFMDADEAVGGQNKGLRPKAMMLSSLAGCTGMDVASLVKKMRAEAEDFKVRVSGELTDEHPKYYHKVKVEYIFYGNNLNHKKLEKAVKLSVERYCGVFAMFRQFAKVETEIKYVENL